MDVFYDQNACKELLQHFSFNIIEASSAGTGAILSGSDSTDIFRFDQISHEVSIFRDFYDAEDAIDLSGMIQDSDIVQEAIDEFVIQTQGESGLEIWVDADGAGEQAMAKQIAVIEGQTAELDFTSLVLE